MNKASTWILVLIAYSLAGPATTAASGSLPHEARVLHAAGWDAAYRTDYDKARAKFGELQKLVPNHPIGDMSLACIIWQDYLFRTRRLLSNTYHKESSFYSGVGSEGDSVDPQVDAQFQELISRALRNAQVQVDLNPRDPQALYFLGAIYGVRAAYEASAQRRFWAALRDGLRSVKLHQEVIDIDPKVYDAYLTIGTYHYVVGSIPQPFRAIATMAGIHGGRRKGIAELESAMFNGIFNRNDARTILIALYRYEGSPQRSLIEVQALSALYPENPLLRLETASTLIQLHRMPEATALFEDLLAGSDHRLDDLVHYQFAEALAQNRAYAAAANHFAAVELASQAYPPLVAQALLRAGQMYDLAGNRAEAIRMYRASLTRTESGDQRKIAERLIRQPFTGN